MNAAIAPDSVGPRSWWDGRVFVVLLAGALLGSVTIVPYALELSGQTLADMGDQPALIWALAALQNTILAGLAAVLGLWLGAKVGVGAPLLRKLVHGSEVDRGRLVAGLRWAVALGVGAALLIVALDELLFSAQLASLREAASTPSPFYGLLASFYGGIVEELLLRLGLMTLVLWLLNRLSGAGTVTRWQIWCANIVAALLFGLGHLPLTAALAPLTALLVVRALLLNGIPGVAFGWLYAEYGILLAIVSHFSADIVLHVLLPLFFG